MRKVEFYIDDLQYFRNDFKIQNPELTDIQIDNMLEGLKPFKAIYTLFGDGKCIDRYEMKDENGNKINFNDLNGFQKSITWDCDSYFEGSKSFEKGNELVGVINIVESEA